MRTWFARNILLPTRPRARRLADWCRVGRLFATTHDFCALCVCTCSRMNKPYAAVSVVMRLEKRVRTKKWVAYVCYFARDAARAIEGGFWTLADEVEADERVRKSGDADGRE